MNWYHFSIFYIPVSVGGYILSYAIGKYLECCAWIKWLNKQR